MQKKHLSSVGHPPKAQGQCWQQFPCKSLSTRAQGLCSMPKLEAGAWKDLSCQCNKHSQFMGITRTGKSCWQNIVGHQVRLGKPVTEH